MKRHDYPYDFSEKYSYKDFTGQILVENKDMDGVAIYGSCFSQEIPNTEVFPSKLKNTIFISCNLDNVLIPDGNTVIECTQRIYKVQNDGNDWLLDENGLPEKPVNHKVFTKFKLPMPDPKDIPIEKVEEFIDLRKVAEQKKAEAEPDKALAEKLRAVAAEAASPAMADWFNAEAAKLEASK